MVAAAELWASQRASALSASSLSLHKARNIASSSPLRNPLRNPRPVLTWGTTLGMRVVRSTVFAERVAKLLPQQWHILNRTSVLSRLASPGTWTGVRWNNKHAPHAINWVDNQRLLQLLLLAPSGGHGGGDGGGDGGNDGDLNGGDVTSSIGDTPNRGDAAASDIPSLFAPIGTRLRVNRQCLGLDLPKTGGFIEAWQHFCPVEMLHSTQEDARGAAGAMDRIRERSTPSQQRSEPLPGRHVI